MDSIINVRDCGAVGDGRTDDTDAIRKAAEHLPPKDGVLCFPPGWYRTDTIRARSFTTYWGGAAWAYSYRPPGGTVLSPVREDQPCLFSVEDAHGVRFHGLTLRGTVPGDDPRWPAEGLPGDMHGVRFLSADQAVVDDCRIERFTGHGLLFAGGAGVWSVRHSLILFNRRNGIEASASADSWILDTQLTSNGEAGAVLHASATVTGNRIEHNYRAGIRIASGYASSIQITGNLFCCNGGPALEHEEGRAEGITVTGNTFRRLVDVAAPADAELNTHARLIDFQGLVFTGNSLYCDRQTRSVATGMILARLCDSVVSRNALFHAATRQLIDDRGGHQNTVIADNPGRLL